MTDLPVLTIVLPCYNPADKWGEQVVYSMNQLKSELKNKTSELQLLIINDGSTEGFNQGKQVVENGVENVKFVEYTKNKGKGHALREGIKTVQTGFIVYTDIDFPYEEDSVIAIANSLIEGNEVALGHRGKDYYDKTPWFRKVVSKTLRWTLKTFLRLPTDDSQCGLKGFNQKGAKVFLDTKIDRFLFDMEFIKLASKRKLKIAVVSVDLKPNVMFSKVSLKILIREFGNFLKVLFRK